VLQYILYLKARFGGR